MYICVSVIDETYLIVKLLTLFFKDVNKKYISKHSLLGTCGRWIHFSISKYLLFNF